MSGREDEQSEMKTEAGAEMGGEVKPGEILFEHTFSEEPIEKKSLPKKKRTEVSELQERIRFLTEELELREAELRQATDESLRAVADAENYKKRIAREGSDAIEYAALKTFESIIPSLDNLQNALNAAKEENADLETLKSGVEMVFSQMVDALAAQGLERISSVGAPFDPETAEAIQIMETDEHPDGVVVAEFAPGYRLRNRVVRTAKVVVAKNSS